MLGLLKSVFIGGLYGIGIVICVVVIACIIKVIIDMFRDSRGDKVEQHRTDAN